MNDSPPVNASGWPIFLLTDEWEDRDGRCLLRFYGRSAPDAPQPGRPVQIVVTNFRPVFFVNRGSELPDLSVRYERKAVDLRNFDDEAVDALYFQGEHDLRRAREALFQQGLVTYESDVHPCERFRMERFLFGGVVLDLDGAELADNSGDGPLIFQDPKLRAGGPNLDATFTTASLDIETGVSSGLLYSIAVHVRTPEHDERRVFMLDTNAQHPGVFQKLPAAENTSMELAYYKDERMLLRAFFEFFRGADPDIIIGWNVDGFDLAFLANKCRSLGVPFALSRHHRREAIMRKRANGSEMALIPGRVVLDGPTALRAAFYNFSDFRLESVARELLGRGKLIQEDRSRRGKWAKIEEIDRQFREDKPALARYNLEDCVLVSEIFAKTGLVQLWKSRTKSSGMLMDQIGRSVAAFDHQILPRLHRKGYVAIAQQDVQFDAPAPGGYVMEPASGLYEHVVVLDFRSLYPSIIRTFKIDPYSRLKQDVDPVELPAGGYTFSRTEHLLPEIIGELLETRAAAKKKGDEHLSQAVKILMNSFYGVMGSPGCRFYHPDLPSGITRTGQWLLLESRKFLENEGYEVLYGDTDSLFVLLREEDAGRHHERGTELARALNVRWTERLRSEFRLESFLEMEYEKYYRKFFLPPARGGGAAKKRYVGLLSKEGDASAKEELHFVGMETVRSDWTDLAKNFQRGLYERVFADEEVDDWIKTFAADVRSGRYDDDLVYRKRLRKPVREYVKNIPQHVRAAKMLDDPGVRSVHYLMTKSGPVPVQLEPRDIDYDYYLEHQLKPIADTLLGFFDTNFDGIVRGSQLSLF